MNREQSRIYVDRRAAAVRWWPELIAKLAAYFMVCAVFSTMILSAMPEVERPGAVPEHSTIGLMIGLLSIVLRLAIGPMQKNGHISAHDGAVGSSMRGDLPGRWLHYRLRRILIDSLGWLVISGLFMAALSPIAIRLWDTGFDLASIATPLPWLETFMAVQHWFLAMLLLAAMVIELGFLLWRQFKLRDGALVRALPFGILWQRLAAHQHYLQERMPSRHIAGWPRGRLS